LGNTTALHVVEILDPAGWSRRCTIPRSSGRSLRILAAPRRSRALGPRRPRPPPLRPEISERAPTPSGGPKESAHLYTTPQFPASR